MTNSSYDTADTALLLVNLLNDFLDPKGKLAGRIGTMLAKTNLEANLARLVAGARAAGVKLVYVPHGLDDHSFDDVRHVHPRFQMAIENKLFWKGEWGSEFYPALAPRAGDIVVHQHRTFDGFINTDLLARLRAEGIEKVVLAGLTSHTCIESTGRHALEEGFHVTFLTDAVAELTQEAHDAAIGISYPTFGHEVTTIDGFLDAIERGKGSES